ncbi:hypothetical protein V491_01652 [Pseudogymnoascus sp. VKM F-3775]|nr:hypothetical protein V491_01652 [Pseudogymnoascus sp. VKM F-3775]
MLLTRPRHSQCLSTTWAARRLLAAARLQCYSTDGQATPPNIRRVDFAQKGGCSWGSATHEDGGMHKEGGRVRDGAQKLSRRPPPKFRRKEGAAAGDGIGAELKELGSALRDASLVDSTVADPQATNSSTPKTLRANEKPNTILEELFPEYKDALSDTTDTNPKSSSTDDLPKLDPSTLGLPQSTSWKPLNTPKPDQPFLHPDHQPPVSPSVDPHTLRQRLAATVLVISSTSRHLALSDFIRLSPRGSHIEGWTSGIQRVIPGRDPTTLARQSHYFVLFSTAAAAQAYKDNIARLHHLSRKWTPTCATSRMAPVPGVLVDGEDVASLVSAFTIVPSSQRLLFSKVVKKPYRPAVARMIETGGYHPLITPEAGRQGENLVLVGLDRGKMNAFELGLAIGLDGKERNLQWRLEGGKEDIVLLGSKSDPKVVEGEQYEDEEEGWDSEGGEWQREKKKGKGMRGPPRFIVKFKDSAEARRFVRAWHSRILEGEALERLAKAGVGEQAQVSAEVLW